jgi:hypothetical protein
MKPTLTLSGITDLSYSDRHVPSAASHFVPREQSSAPNVSLKAFRLWRPPRPQRTSPRRQTATPQQAPSLNHDHTEPGGDAAASRGVLMTRPRPPKPSHKSRPNPIFWENARGETGFHFIKRAVGVARFPWPRPERRCGMVDGRSTRVPATEPRPVDEPPARSARMVDGSVAAWGRALSACRKPLASRCTKQRAARGASCVWSRFHSPGPEYWR